MMTEYVSQMFISFWNKYGEKLKSIAIGAAIAGAGALATSGLESLAQVDFGEYTVYVGAFCAILANILRKFGVPVATTLAKSIRKGGTIV